MIVSEIFEKLTMRTTLALDEDVFHIARQKAQREHIFIGAAVSELMRLGIGSMQMPAVQPPGHAQQICSTASAQRDHHQRTRLQTHGTRTYLMRRLPDANAPVALMDKAYIHHAVAQNP